MQCTSFLPGCYTNRDVNMGTKNGVAWPIYTNERTLQGGHSYNVFLPPQTKNQFLIYDNEVLRQTMLKHESIFRDQVHELHRLYRRQRELMDEIKRRELLKQHLKIQPYQSNSFLPNISSETAQMTMKIPNLPRENPAASRLSISCAENFQSSSNFSEWKSSRASPDFVQAEGSSNDCKLPPSKCKKPKKKTLDLELPADEYIDSEEEDQFGEEKISKVPVVPCYPAKCNPWATLMFNSKLMPSGGMVNSIFQDGSSSTNSLSKRARELADLNEPILIEDVVASDSANCLGSEAYHKVTYQDQELSGKPKSDFPAFSREVDSSIWTGRTLQSSLNSTHPEDSKHKVIPDEAGLQRIKVSNSLPYISSSGKLTMPLKQLKIEPPAEFHMVDSLEYNGKWQNQGTISFREASGRNCDPSKDDNGGPAVSLLTASNQLVPWYGMETVDLSLVSSLGNQTGNLGHNPAAAQELPCSNITMPSSKNTKVCGARGNSNSVGSQSEFRTEVCLLRVSSDHLKCLSANASPSEAHTNCFPYSSGRVSVKAMDLNKPPCSLTELEASQQNAGNKDEAKKFEDSEVAMPQPGEKPYCSNKPDGESEDLPHSDQVSSQAFPVSICDAKEKRFQSGECPHKGKTVGSSNFGKPHVSVHEYFSLASSLNSHLKSLEGDEIKTNYPALASEKCCSVEHGPVNITVDNKFSGVGKQLDLNSCINEDESSTLFLSEAIAKTVAETDLEAPVSPENKECSPPRGESEENQLEMPVKLSKQEDKDQSDELVRVAAEAIVTLSTNGLQELLFKNPICEMSETSPCESLNWFAEIVSSRAHDLECEFGVFLSSESSGDQREFSSDGSDYFEAMTLELNETKVEEYSHIIADKKEEAGAVLSPCQPRRGRMRRGRQSKDFQTEILPSLTSLSRHEVTEDLQTIGGLMEAAGLAVEIGTGRRNVGRFSRVRRRLGNSLCHEMENPLGSLLKQQNKVSDLVSGISSLQGWGKINRRRRGPRIPASTPPHLFS